MTWFEAHQWIIMIIPCLRNSDENMKDTWKPKDTMVETEGWHNKEKILICCYINSVTFSK